MLRYVANYLQTIPPVFLDGSLYFLIAVFAFLQTSFGSDEAAKFVDATPLYWIRTVLGSFSAGLLAVKMFRSTAFAEHQQAKKDGNTNFFKKNETNTGP